MYRSIGLDENDRDLAEFLVFISTALALHGGIQYIPSVRNGAPPPPIAGGHTLLAAAASDETALDTRRHGLFTEELLKNFKSGRTYQEAFNPTKLAVMQRAKRLIRNHQQTPQIENGGGSILSCFI